MQWASLATRAAHLIADESLHVMPVGAPKDNAAPQSLEVLDSRNNGCLRGLPPQTRGRCSPLPHGPLTLGVDKDKAARGDLEQRHPPLFLLQSRNESRTRRHAAASRPWRSTTTFFLLGVVIELVQA